MTFDRPIFIGVMLVAILLIVFILVLPEYDNFKQLQAQLGEKRAEYVAQHDHYAAIDKVYDDLQVRKDDIAKIDEALSSDPALGKTVYLIQEVAQKSGLIVKNLFLSQGSSKESVAGAKSSKEISFSVDLLGNYPSLGSFIRSLEDSSRIFEITSISFGTQSEPPYNFSLQIKTYSY
jgi:Tfp pilus assembly protein PilO